MNIRSSKPASNKQTINNHVIILESFHSSFKSNVIALFVCLLITWEWVHLPPPNFQGSSQCPRDGFKCKKFWMVRSRRTENWHFSYPAAPTGHALLQVGLGTSQHRGCSYRCIAGLGGVRGLMQKCTDWVTVPASLAGWPCPGQEFSPSQGAWFSCRLGLAGMPWD